MWCCHVNSVLLPLLVNTPCTMKETHTHIHIKFFIWKYFFEKQCPLIVGLILHTVIVTRDMLSFLPYYIYLTTIVTLQIRMSQLTQNIISLWNMMQCYRYNYLTVYKVVPISSIWPAATSKCCLNAKSSVINNDNPVLLYFKVHSSDLVFHTSRDIFIRNGAAEACRMLIFWFLVPNRLQKHWLRLPIMELKEHILSLKWQNPVHPILYHRLSVQHLWFVSPQSLENISWAT